MPTQEACCAGTPARLLGAVGRGPHAVLLDGGGPDSWGAGAAIYSDRPRAILEVFESGWGRWRRDGATWWVCAPPLAQWNRFLDECPRVLSSRPTPELAGFVSVLSYDLKHWTERLPRRQTWTGLPILYSAFFDWSYRHDYRSGRGFAGAQSEKDLAERVGFVAGAASTAALSGKRRGGGRLLLQPTVSKDVYLRMIERARQYIAAGDVYQVNLAQSFTLSRPSFDPAELFRRLCADYPMPFGAFVDGGDWVAVSNSPECLLTVDGSDVATFPIKGTERLSADNSAGSLAVDPKERAEHVMIVDLERNDLGRVCEIGSVQVKDFAAVRSFPLLQHMISEVRGRLKPDTSPAQWMEAMFPGGSITGAPKIRAMQIIDELEPSPRGFYTGAIGWTDLNGKSRFNIAIRTAVVTREGLTYHAGGGIVTDSDPEREYEETLLKSEAFFRALSEVDDE